MLENISWTEVREQFKKKFKKLSKLEKKILPQNVMKRDVRKLKMIISKESGLTDKNIFDKSWIANINREKRYKLLKILAKHMKTIALPSLIKYQKEKHISWAKKYIKFDFFIMILVIIVEVMVGLQVSSFIVINRT